MNQMYHILKTKTKVYAKERDGLLAIEREDARVGALDWTVASGRSRIEAAVARVACAAAAS